MGGTAVIMPRTKTNVAWLSLSFLFWGLPSSALAQSSEPPAAAGAQSGLGGASTTGAASARGQLAEPQSPGSIHGTVVDRTGAFIVGARVKLTEDDPSQNQEVSSDDGGQFLFANVTPGLFQLTITLSGFATQSLSGVLSSGEVYTVPQTTLAIATATTEIRVVPTVVEVAEDEIKVEEKQRVLGVFPNFYVSYVPNAAPLSPKQKFELPGRRSGSSDLRTEWSHRRNSAGAKRFQRIRARRARLCKALRRVLCRPCYRHVHRKSDPAVAPETRSTLFLQGKRQQAIADSLCDCQRRDLQGRQRPLAGKLFEYPRKPSRRRHLKSLLSSEKSRWRGVNVRKRSHRNWRISRREYLSRISSRSPLMPFAA